jgi:hypothetical protein
MTKPAFRYLMLVFLLSITVSGCDLITGSPDTGVAPATGPLSVLTSNPRYFTDGSGKAIYLCGSHTWGNFAVDHGINDPPGAFDYDKFLDFLVGHNHNFFRGWVWELPYSMDGSSGPFYNAPFPWLRTGPGTATDGDLKFDLDQFNQAYFDRIRSRVIAARDRGIYVSIMFFNGFGLQFNRTDTDGFPLDGRNNINGVDAGPGYEANTLTIPAVTARQEAYIRKIIDSVNDLDNVLYEVSNESGSYAKAWQYYMIDFIHQYEKSKPEQHPVGMTFQYEGGTNAELFASHAEWISPNGADGYGTDPPPADGRKVLINDTDHSYYWVAMKEDGTAVQQRWIWKNFTRGNYILYMDPYLTKYNPEWSVPIGTDPVEPIFGLEPDPYWDVIREAMGRTRTYAVKMDLALMTPQGALSSTAYCLANVGAEYLIYQPLSNIPFTVVLPAGTYRVEWYTPTTGAVRLAGTVEGGDKRSFTAPFSGDAVLYLKKEAD